MCYFRSSFIIFKQKDLVNNLVSILRSEQVGTISCELEIIDITMKKIIQQAYRCGLFFKSDFADIFTELILEPKEVLKIADKSLYRVISNCPDFLIIASKNIGYLNQKSNTSLADCLVNMNLGMIIDNKENYYNYPPSQKAKK